MTDNDPSESIKSVAKLKQVVHKDIQNFSYNVKKGPIFITGHERQEERAYGKAFKQAGEPSVGCEKISVTTLPLTSGHLDYYMWDIGE